MHSLAYGICWWLTGLLVALLMLRDTYKKFGKITVMELILALIIVPTGFIGALLVVCLTLCKYGDKIVIKKK